MLIISLILSAIFFLVTKFTKPFCLVAISCAAVVLFSFESVALAQGVPTLAPPDPTESAEARSLLTNEVTPQQQLNPTTNQRQTNKSSTGLNAPALLEPESGDRSKRFRSSTSESLPMPNSANTSRVDKPQNSPRLKGTDLKGPALAPPSVRAMPNGESTHAKRAWSIPREQHPWARFSNGAWRTFRVLSESFDETGISLGLSTTIRTESLMHVGKHHYQLQISTLVDVGGKRLPSTPQEVALDLLTDGLIPPNTIKEQGSTSISLQGQSIPCKTWDLMTPLDRGERHELVYYSSGRAPYVLRRERIDSIQGQEVGRKTTNILREGMPIRLGESLAPSRHVFVTEQFANGGYRECFELHSDRLPGGLMESTEIDYGPTGLRFRWSTTELIGAGLQQGIPLFLEAEPASASLQTPPSGSLQFNLPTSRNRLPGLLPPRPSLRPAPQLQVPPPSQSLQPIPTPRRGNKRDSEDRDDDDDDDDDDRDDRRRDDDDRDDDRDDVDEIRPRRLLRLLRRADVYLPAEIEPSQGSQSL